MLWKSISIVCSLYNAALAARLVEKSASEISAEGEISRKGGSEGIIGGCGAADQGNFEAFRNQLATTPDTTACCGESTSKVNGGLDHLGQLYFLDSSEDSPGFRYEDGNVLTFTWGYDFKGRDQVLAWKYSPAEEKIKFFYAKDDHLDRDDTNQIGMGMIGACRWNRKKCPDLEWLDPKKKYRAGSPVQLPELGTLALAEVPDADGKPAKMRLVKPHVTSDPPGMRSPCILRYVYSCQGGKDHVAVFKDAHGNDC